MAGLTSDDDAMLQQRSEGYQPVSSFSRPRWCIVSVFSESCLEGVGDGARPCLDVRCMGPKRRSCGRVSRRSNTFNAPERENRKPVMKVQAMGTCRLPSDSRSKLIQRTTETGSTMTEYTRG